MPRILSPMRRAIVVLLFTAACATTHAPDVREAQQAWMNALNALDEAGIVNAFAEDATAFFPVVKAERVDGKPAIAKVFHDYVAGRSCGGSPRVGGRSCTCTLPTSRTYSSYRSYARVTSANSSSIAVRSATGMSPMCPMRKVVSFQMP
jgi:hypothetical protein